MGLKAQIVAYDRATCVAYYGAISAILGPDEQACVVMTTMKNDPAEWDRWNLDRDQEAVIEIVSVTSTTVEVRDRHGEVADWIQPAPIEGVIMPRQAVASTHCSKRSAGPTVAGQTADRSGRVARPRC